VTTRTLHDALMEAAGPRAFAPPEAEIVYRSRRQARHARLLGACAVMCAAAMLAATAGLPGRSRRVIINPANWPTPQMGPSGPTSPRLPFTFRPSAPTITPLPDGSVSIRPAGPLRPSADLLLPGSRNELPDFFKWFEAPPAGTRVTFLSDAGIESMHPDGTDRRMMAKRWVEGDLLAWSPNGRYLAMQGPGTRDGHNAIVLADTATGKAWRLTDWFDGDPTSAAFSPDGKWLAFAQGTTTAFEIPPHIGVDARIAIVSLDGSKEVDVPGTGASVTYRPNGDGLVYAGCYNDAYTVCTVKADGSEVQTIPNLKMRNVVLSPDGVWLAGAMQSQLPDKGGDMLGIVHPDGTDEQTVDGNNALLGSPTWMPDSRTIIYATTNWECQGNRTSPVPPPPTCAPSNLGLMSASIADFSVKVLTTHGERSPMVGTR
jgi:hypothetical protein